MQKVVHIDQMKEWNLYPTNRDMRRAWNEYIGKDTEEDFENEEKIIKAMNKTTR